MSFALFSEASQHTVTMCAIGEQGLACVCAVDDGVLQVGGGRLMPRTSRTVAHTVSSCACAWLAHAAYPSRGPRGPRPRGGAAHTACVRVPSHMHRPHRATRALCRRAPAPRPPPPSPAATSATLTHGSPPPHARVACCSLRKAGTWRCSSARTTAASWCARQLVARLTRSCRRSSRTLWSSWLCPPTDGASAARQRLRVVCVCVVVCTLPEVGREHRGGWLRRCAFDDPPGCSVPTLTCGVRVRSTSGVMLMVQVCGVRGHGHTDGDGHQL